MQLTSPSAKGDSDTDHAGSGRESRDSHVGLYWAALGSNTEQSVSSNSIAAAIVKIMWLGLCPVIWIWIW